MTQNKLYALNQVEQCNVAPEVSRASVTLYTKHFLRTINATMCRVKHQSEEWHCGHHDHFSMSILHNGITSDLSLSPETCKAMGEGKEVIIHGQLLRFKKGVKQVPTRNAKYGKVGTEYVTLIPAMSARQEDGSNAKLSNLTFKTLNYQSKPEMERSSHSFRWSFPVLWSNLVVKRRHWTPTHTHGQNPIIACLQYTERKW